MRADGASALLSARLAWLPAFGGFTGMFFGLYAHDLTGGGAVADFDHDSYRSPPAHRRRRRAVQQWLGATQTASALS
ncbi:hypothetical protein [Micromonospora sp. NPDC005305]|uniref:beta-xylosidase family glycoside hydrolase n=1 Tax=Micromonospora sp. NPDC005305 TaxID=3156875 RepID=UPI0033ACE716